MTSAPPAQDWDPALYDRFRGLRLRPALDLLAQIGPLPEGDVVDLGCGSGAAGAALAQRFPGRRITGIDQSPAMLEEAEGTGAYTRLSRADIADWTSERPVALVFCNAVLNWLPDHASLVPRLARLLAPGGWLAVQAPRQQDAPSHALLRSLSAEMFPNRFDWAAWRDNVEDIGAYAQILAGLGEAELWETTYAQRLAPVPVGHPVRHYTQSTAGRRVLDRLAPDEAAAFLAAYDAALAGPYPPAADGSVLMPFRRIFFTLRRTV